MTRTHPDIINRTGDRGHLRPRAAGVPCYYCFIFLVSLLQLSREGMALECRSCFRGSSLPVRVPACAADSCRQDHARAFSVLSRRGELYFRFAEPPPALSGELSRILYVDRVTGGQVYAYANTARFKKFVDFGIPYEVLPPPSALPALKSGRAGSDLRQWDSYPSWYEYLEMMYSFAGSFPEICRLDTIGFSARNRLILAVKISDSVHAEESEPVFFYSSTMHGDETTGYVLMLRLIDHLLGNYPRDSRVRQLVDNCQIWINPLANPDGTYFFSNASVYLAKRTNANNVDLNRNFPDPAEGDHPDGQPWQPETLAMMAFMEKTGTDLSANIHSGAEVINYPWDTWTRAHADEPWYRMIGRDYADTVRARGQDYFMQFAGGITRGIDWYRITGGRQDYVNWFLHSREVTMELSLSKMPDGSSLPALWEYNREALLNFTGQSLYGIRGTVSDQLTGLPVKAMVGIPGHDADNSFVFSDSLNGSYYRYLKEGVYNLEFSAPGYHTRTLADVAVYDRQHAILDVRMTPLDRGNSLLKDRQKGIQMKGHVLCFETPRPVQSSLYVYDLSGRQVVPVTSRMSVVGTNEIDLGTLLPGRGSGTGLPGGFYILQLILGEQAHGLKYIPRH